MAEGKQKCFVIMPFSKTSKKHTEEYWTTQFKDFLKPLIETGHQLIAERSSPLREDIVGQIIRELVTAPIVVADLTDANPNVYWELGVRQSFKHCTITIAEHKTKIPFDIGAKATLYYYPDDHIKMQEFKIKFDEALNDCLINPHFPDSHVLETISGRGSLFQIIMRVESLRKLAAIISEIKRNKNILKQVIKICNENIEVRKETKEKKGEEVSLKLVTSRFRIAAVSLLVVSRYIDADEEFYKIAEEYFDHLLRWNDQLSSWETKPLSTEPWILKSNEELELCINEFEKLITGMRKHIETLF